MLLSLIFSLIALSAAASALHAIIKPRDRVLALLVFGAQMVVVIAAVSLCVGMLPK